MRHKLLCIDGSVEGWLLTLWPTSLVVALAKSASVGVNDGEIDKLVI